jgi:hypothetical protein
VVPFRIEDAPISKELEYFLSASHWLDAVTPPLEKHMAELAETCRLLLLRTPQEKDVCQPSVPIEAGAAGTKTFPCLHASLILGTIIFLAAAYWVYHLPLWHPDNKLVDVNSSQTSVSPSKLSQGLPLQPIKKTAIPGKETASATILAPTTPTPMAALPVAVAGEITNSISVGLG